MSNRQWSSPINPLDPAQSLRASLDQPPGGLQLPVTEVYAHLNTSMNCDGSSGSLNLEHQIAATFMKAFNVFKERQRKYGSNNIARRGAAGVVVRLDDKLARLDQLVAGKGNEVLDESVEDTILDIINYAAIAGICLEGRWPDYHA